MTIEEAAAFLDEYQETLEELPGIVIESLQESGRELPKQIGKLFNREKYADERGRVVKLRSYGPTWGATKRRVRFDLRRGHATKTASRAIGDKRSFGRLPAGFVIDIDKTARRWRADYRKLGRKRKIRVSMYLQHYVNAKAPGFLSLSKEQQERIGLNAAHSIAEAFEQIDAARTKLSIEPDVVEQRFEVTISRSGLENSGVRRVV